MAEKRRIALSKQLLLTASVLMLGVGLPPMAVAAESAAGDAKDDSKAAPSESGQSVQGQSAQGVSSAATAKDGTASPSASVPSSGGDSSQAQKTDDPSIPIVKTGLDSKTLKLINQGDWKGAASILEKATAGVDEPTRDHAWLGFAYMFLNRTADLKKLFVRVATAAKSKDDERMYLSCIEAFNQVLEGKPDLAEKTLADLPRAYSNDAFVNFARAAVAGKQGKAQLAVDFCKKTIAEDPKFAWGYRTLGFLQSRWLNQPAEAEKSLTQALALEPSQGEVREMLINERLAKNDFDTAIDIAVEGVQSNKKDGKSHYRLSQIYIQQWRLREALDELKKAISADPDTASYYRTRATIRRYQGNFADAIEDQKKAVSLSKDKPFELVELSNMYSQEGDNATAITTLNDALKIDPANNGAQKALLALLAKEKRFDDLVAAYKNSIKSQPKDAALHFNLAETLHALGEDDDALAEYREAANADPKDPRPHRRVGAIYTQRKELDKAEDAYKRALGINSFSIQDLVALAFCYTQRENYLQAEAAFVTSLALQQLTGNTSPEDPKREDILRSLSSLLLVEGRYEEARSNFETVYNITRDTVKGSGDKYLLQQAKLLADRKSKTAEELIEYYKSLPKQAQDAFRYTLVQTLLKAGKADYAAREMSELSDDAIEQDLRWLSLKARASRLQGKLDIALSTIDNGIKKVSAQGDGKDVLLAEMLLEKAKILSESGKLKEAEETANQSLSKYDKVYASYLVLGQVKLKLNDAAGASALATKVLEQN
ncbi:MAG: tetratricopeptide repeat protein, partial [Candidatus Obscuribacterales bacterium]|nr:tetratricopeptide repeat protein [Candidatus Obscuribacterales bacterium]